MKRFALALCCLAAAPLRAESHFALRSISSLLRESPAELEFITFEPPFFVAQGVHRRLFPHDWDLVQDQSLRLYGGEDRGPFRLEWNLLAEAVESSERNWLPSQSAQDGRSRALEGWSPVHGDGIARAEIDQLNLRWQGQHGSAILGRQPVNLGVGFYFSPLDAFAQFSPTETYRDFRPGVDALRLSWSPSDYSLVELIGVAGYRPKDPWALPPDPLDLDGPYGQGSLLVRAQANGNAWSLTLQGGRRRDQAELGGAVQIEWLDSSWSLEGDWLADLAETQVWTPDGPARVRYHQPTWNAGFSRQWNSWLSSRLEGGAVGTLDAYDNGDLAFHWAQDRAALSLQAQASPLWVLSGAVFWTGGPGDSLQLLATAERSVSDDSSVTLSLSGPVLWPQSGVAPDEFSPYGIRLDWRLTI